MKKTKRHTVFVDSYQSLKEWKTEIEVLIDEYGEDAELEASVEKDPYSYGENYCLEWIITQKVGKQHKSKVDSKLIHTDLENQSLNTTSINSVGAYPQKT